MTLIKSISGIRGTIGGKAGECLTPPDIVKYAAAFGVWVKKNTGSGKRKLVIGRDARPSGNMVSNIITGTLSGLGFDIINIGLATTPTVEIAVPEEKADGGIIITASHNPEQWNALKLLNSRGEFLSDKDGKEILEIAEDDNIFKDIYYSEVEGIGEISINEKYNKLHIGKITDLDMVDIDAIKRSDLRITIDCVNSVGGLVIPDLLKALGVKDIVKLYCEPTGRFPHNPEPLPEHLKDISEAVKTSNSDLGFVVDPDVDRLAIVNEDGTMFGEEYTLVAVADYILKHKKGNTVSNMSSTRALRDITEKHGCKYEASAVGEVNVVEKMKTVNAVIGGEGNGGVIYPELHYGRDALVGIALFLSHYARSGKKCSELRSLYPDYYISKNKVQLTPDTDVDNILANIMEKYKNYPLSTIDGIKIDFEKEWVHLRRSNTEPIIRIYAESSTKEKADALAESVMNDLGVM